jgi:hypothetical protein
MPHRLALLFSLLFVTASSSGQMLTLDAPSWKTTPSRYHVRDVKDLRKGATGEGKTIRSGTGTPLKLKPTAEIAINHLVRLGLQQDSLNTVPLILEIRKLNITDVVASNHHKIAMDMVFRLVREIDGTSQELFEQTIKPTVYKPEPLPPGSMENLLSESLHDFFTAFDEMIAGQPDHPLLIRSVLLTFEQDPIQNYSDTILWNENYHLTWDDFKGKDTNPSGFSAQSNCLYTLEKIPDYRNDTMIIRIIMNPCFTRKASWVHQDALQDTLLMHEQLHFDLCELYGRIFRKEASLLQPNPLNADNQINKVFAEMWRNYQLEQDRYDSETQHGTITSEQLRWISDTRMRLDELKSWQR